MSSTAKLGVGIIGTGSVSDAHIENFRGIEGVELRSICSRSKDRAQAKAQSHQLTNCLAFESLEAFLADDGLDIVVTATPHANHPREVIAAAEAGKHVVIEKPVALDRGAMAEMLAAVEKAGVKTSVCFELRWIGLFKNVRALMEQGLIGTPFYGETSYFHGIGPWIPQHPWNRKKESGGDTFLTAGCHALDGLIWLMGSEVESVSAMSGISASNPLDYEYDPNVVVILRFKNGAIGKVAASIECRQPYLFPVLIQGDEGSIWNDRISSLNWPGLPKDKWAQIPTAVPDSGAVEDHPYRGQFEHMVACIRENRRPHNDLASCAHVHDVMFAIQRALSTRQEVKVEATPGANTIWE